MKPDQKYAARMKAEGFVKPAVWIPADRVDELKAIAEKMRKEHKPKTWSETHERD